MSTVTSMVSPASDTHRGRDETHARGTVHRDGTGVYGRGDCAGPARGGDMAEPLLAHLQDEGEEPLEVGPGVGARGEEAARLGPRAQHRAAVVFRAEPRQLHALRRGLGRAAGWWVGCGAAYSS